MLAMCSLGCATTYVPPAAHVAALSKPGDLDLALRGGTGGAQIDVAFAVMNGLAVRASGQASGSPAAPQRQDFHRAGEVGAGWYWSPKPDEGGGDEASEDAYNLLSPKSFHPGLRTSVFLSVGGGASQSSYSVASHVTTSSGTFWKEALQGDLLYSWRWFETGMALRATHVDFFHDAQSSKPDARGRAVLGEVFGVVRAGPPRLRGELQLGLAAPLYAQEATSAPFPFVLSFGLVSEL